MRGFARVSSAQPNLLSAEMVSVETDITRGLYSFTIVGLPNKAVEEARDRVSSAIKHAGFQSPKSENCKVTISLAPAELRKEGAYFDLPIALSYLLAADILLFNPERTLFVGELTLDGYVRSVRGVLSIAQAARAAGYTELYVPEANAAEAALIEGIAVYPVQSLRELIDHLNQDTPPSIAQAKQTAFTPIQKQSEVDFSDVRGQENAKRALEIAAAGRHNVVMYGPPGTGKTLLAKAFSGILPPLTFIEALEATAIHSVTGILSGELMSAPPFRSPHHTSSYVALVGGGASLRPGEITLAHKGVLFLDEIPEFDRRAIDSLREPLESRSITISRAKGTMVFPADFILIGAMNPSRSHTPDDLLSTDKKALARKISGPIADRVDLWVPVTHILHKVLTSKSSNAETSATIRERVISARAHQNARFKGTRITNSTMGVRHLEQLVPLSAPVSKIIEDAAEKLHLSPRSFHRTIKVARTIADIANERFVGENHILEALSYRPKDLF